MDLMDLVRDRVKIEVFFLNREPQAISNFLRENHVMMLSTSFSGLVLTGRHLWAKSGQK